MDIKKLDVAFSFLSVKKYFLLIFCYLKGIGLFNHPLSVFKLKYGVHFSYEMENYRYKIQKDIVPRDEKLSIYIYIIPRLTQLKQFLEVGFNLPPLRVSLNYLSRIINISPYHLKKNLHSLRTHHHFSFWDLEKLLNLNNLMTITIEPSLALISSYFLVLSINSKHSSIKFIENFFKKYQISYCKEETLWGFYI